jgi:hypothetical protein
MPLRKGKSKSAHAANVAELIRSGRPVAQANAIAYRVAGEKKVAKKPKPRKPKPRSGY